MNEYLAKYTIEHLKLGVGVLRPRTEINEDEYRFEAQDDEKAIEIALKYQQRIEKKGYPKPTVTLDELLRVEEIEI